MFDELKWVMASPGLLAESAAPLVPDTECDRLVAQATQSYRELEGQPGALDQYLKDHLKSGRLGDRFESLVQFWLERLLGVTELTSGVAIRDQGETLGELDLVFRWPHQPRTAVEHWEAAVKFYMCIAPSAQEASSAKYFVGQALADRLDKKFDLSVNRQLLLPQDFRAQAELQRRGFSGSVCSRLFFKGRLFYPVHWNWSEVSAPSIVSAKHERGWWLAWNGERSLEIFPDAPERGWVLLPKSRWLGSRVQESKESAHILKNRELASALDQHFQKSRNALQLARVQRRPDGSWIELPRDPGPGRGMVLMPGWPESVTDVQKFEGNPESLATEEVPFRRPS